MNVQIGEGIAGAGVDAAHTTTVLGERGGPVETAWVTALSTPTVGFGRFVVCLQPGVPVQPLTLFVPKVAIGDPTGGHARLTFGAAQAALAEAVASSVADGIIDPYDAPRTLLLASVWIDLAALDEEAVFTNQRKAARGALRAGAANTPSVADVLEVAADGAWNPLFRARD